MGVGLYLDLLIYGIVLIDNLFDFWVVPHVLELLKGLDVLLDLDVVLGDKCMHVHLDEPLTNPFLYSSIYLSLTEPFTVIQNFLS